MFDWNDEELSNILWDEAGESDDHIVPYPEAKEVYGKRKEWNRDANNSNSTEQKGKAAIHSKKLETASNFKPNEGASASGFNIDPWPDLSLSTTSKTDDTSISNKLSETEAVKDPDIFRKGKEQGDFVDYGWDNIGSFDDLDRIFSNDDPIFGSVNLGNADELWSSSKDVTNSPSKSFPLFSDSQNFEIKTEYPLDDDQPFTVDYGKSNVPPSRSLQDTCNALNLAGGEFKPTVKQHADFDIMGKHSLGESLQLPQKVHKQKKSSKSRKSDMSLYQKVQNSYGNWSSVGNIPGQFNDQFAPAFLSPSPSVLSQPYQLVSNTQLAPAAYGMPMLPHVGDFKGQPVLSGYEVSSSKPGRIAKLADSMAKTQTMTPQEKIEKLRKRQQMQALLAIQKQQQQFVHQVSCTDQNQIIEGADVEAENVGVIPSFDPSSPVEQDDSSSMSLAVDDCSAEDTVLYRLRDIVGKMDVGIRLCIRDSLFRLAQSALQRHYIGDTSSNNNSNREELPVAKDEIGVENRNVKISEAETETNPIDRTVAHLLFHRPMELSIKHPDTPESPALRRLPSDRKVLGVPKLPTGLPEAVKSKQISFQQGWNNSGPSVESQATSQYKSSVYNDSTADNVKPT